MPYVPRRKYPARKKSAAKSSGKRVYKRRATRKPKSSNYLDTTISVINPGKDKIIKVVKCLPLNVPYQAGGSTKGMNIQMSTTSLTWGQVLVFDPAGVLGNFTGTVSAAGSLLGSSALSEWSAYSLLYTQYKVKKIHLKFNCYSDKNNLDNEPPIMYIRYQKEWISNPGTPNQVTPGILAEQRNVVKKVFTSQHPDFEYSFYPKVARLDDAGGTGVSTDSRVLKAMPFTNCNSPVDLWGVEIYVYWPGSATNNAVIQMDVQYDMEFKTQS